MQAFAKRTPAERYLRGLSATAGMYSHVLVRLKRRPGQKLSEATAYRNEIDKTLENELKGQVKNVVALDALTNFAWELTTPFSSPAEMPTILKQVLESNKVVDNFLPVVRTEPEADPETPPSFENIMNTMSRLVAGVNPDTYDVYNLRLLPCRNTCMPVRELSTKLRDTIEEKMATSNKYYERSFVAKQRIEELQAKIDAEFEKTQNPELATQKASLPNLNLQLDLYKNVGFWSTEMFHGAGSAIAVAAQREQERLTQAPGGEFHKFPFNANIGQRILMVKIGEIFLKKGNRFRFMLQLQNNIQTKIGHIAAITRYTHFFTIHPFPASQCKGGVTPFTDAQLQEIKDAVASIPGVENVGVAIQNEPTLDAIVRSSQYLLANATVTQIPTLEKPVDSTYSVLHQTEENKKLAEALFIPIADDATEEEKKLHKDRKTRAALGLLEATKLGWALDAHNHQPCPFPSRSALMRDISTLNRKITGEFNGMSEPVPNPGEYMRMINDAVITTAEVEAETETEVEVESKVTTTETSTDVSIEASIDTPVSAWVRPQSGINIRVEVNNEFSFVSYSNGPDHIDAVGGQPTSTGAETQTVVALLSGGMDSPVAAFSLMTRGMRVVLVHFQNANLADEDTVKHKIVKLAEQLSRYQISTYLHIVPFSAIQDAIIMEVPGPARMLVYRRFMMHVSARIAHKYNAKFLVVGDALGQVASQTASNLYASYLDAPLPLLSPLIGSNKKDIMNIARKIGTYDISSLPYGDCCSYFLSKHPMTKIRPEILKQYEDSVGVNIDGGAKHLISSAFHASAILRWYKPQDGMEVIRDISAVESKYREVVEEMMLECPMRPKDEYVGMADSDKVNEKNAEEFLRKRAEADAKMLDNETVNVTQDNEVEAEADDMNDLDKENATATTTTISTQGQTSSNKLVSTKKTTADEDLTKFSSSKKLKTSNNQNNKDVTMSTSAILTNTTAAPTKAIDLYAHDNASAYLDNAATTRIVPAALDAMLPYLGGNIYGNSSSQHTMGTLASSALDESRRVILGSINAPLESISQLSHEGAAKVGDKGRKNKDQLLVFTSGGTESNNLAIIGTVRAAVENHLIKIKNETKDHSDTTTPINIRIHLITSALEHSAILEPMQSLEKNANAILLAGSSTATTVNRPISIKVDVSIVRNNTIGEIDTTHIDYLLAQDSIANKLAMEKPNLHHTILSLVSIMHANNEIGIIQPIAKIGSIVSKYRQVSKSHGGADLIPIHTLFHTDACQSYAKIYLDVQECELDLVSLNGHKVHGPKGVGALYIRPTVQVNALTYGGGHEGNIRSGTLNVPSIVGMAAAVAYFHGIQTSLLDTKLSHQSINTPLVRSLPLYPTSSLIPNESAIRIAQNTAKLHNFFVDTFPRPLFNGPSIEYGVETLVRADGTPQVRLPNVLSIILGKGEWIDATAILKFLSARGVYISTGSACASNAEPAPSHVLIAMKVRPDMANATIRVSLGHLTQDSEIEHAKSVFIELAQFMKEKIAQVAIATRR